MEYSVDYFMNKGMSEKFSRFYVSCINNERKHPDYDDDYGEWALSKGFLFSSAKSYGLTENNYNEYLSDEDFYKSWPLNSWTKIWVDDKLTLKYILEGTKFSHLMPKYYFYSNNNSELRELVDNPYGDDIQVLINLIKKHRNIACKPNNGTQSAGFCRLSYDGSSLYINKDKASESDIELFVKSHPNYIFTEYLVPQKRIAEIHRLIHTLRLVTLNTKGNNPIIIGGYLRFGTDNHGEANHLSINDDCKATFDFVSEVNIENGHIGNSKSIYFNKVVNTLAHPNTGVVVDFNIHNWNDIKSQVLELSKYLCNLEFIGFDFGITDNGIKLMEVNTHPGIKYMQVFKSLYDNKIVKDYFMKKLNTK